MRFKSKPSDSSPGSHKTVSLTKHAFRQLTDITSSTNTFNSTMKLWWPRSEVNHDIQIFKYILVLSKQWRNRITRFTIHSNDLLKTNPTEASMVYQLLLFGCQPFPCQCAHLWLGFAEKGNIPNIITNIHHFWKKRRHLWGIRLVSCTTIFSNYFVSESWPVFKLDNAKEHGQTTRCQMYHLIQ